MPTGTTTAGYVLAGGRSSRMGTDKAKLPIRGGTLVEYVAAEVAAAAGSVTIVGGQALQAHRVIPDAVAGFGPVAGIATALADSTAAWTLIVACDMPQVRREWLHGLLDSAGGQVLIPRTADGRIHPLCAVWHASARSAIEQCLDDGIHTVREAIRTLDCRWYDLDDAQPVSNVNTPDEWALLRE
jgi:molybdopterin-guanine dinucleotide biosynthesis protein A